MAPERIEVACPGCGAVHLVRCGGHDEHVRFRFACLSCAADVFVEPDGPELDLGNLQTKEPLVVQLQHFG
jgi:hypothetical protein